MCTKNSCREPRAHLRCLDRLTIESVITINLISVANDLHLDSPAHVANARVDDGELFVAKGKIMGYGDRELCRAARWEKQVVVSNRHKENRFKPGLH